MLYSGKVGFAKRQIKIAPGVYKDDVEVIPVRGNLINTSFSQQQTPMSTIDGVRISSRISILAGPKLTNGMGDIRWVTLNGHKWEVESVMINGRRLELTLGGLFNDKG